MGLFGKPKPPTPPPGMKAEGNSWVADPGRHTCSFSTRGQLISSPKVCRFWCEYPGCNNFTDLEGYTP